MKEVCDEDCLGNLKMRQVKSPYSQLGQLFSIIYCEKHRLEGPPRGSIYYAVKDFDSCRFSQSLMPLPNLI